MMPRHYISSMLLFFCVSLGCNHEPVSVASEPTATSSSIDPDIIPGEEGPTPTETCNPDQVYNGSLFLKDDDFLPLEIFELKTLSRIEGDLFIENTVHDVPCLTDISGSLIIQDTKNLTDFSGFPQLTTIGEDLKIEGYLSTDTTLEMTDFSKFPALLNIGGNLSIAATKNFSSMTLPVLTAIEGTLEITQTETLQSIDFPKLETVLGGVTLDLNSQLNTFSLDALTSIGVLLHVFLNDELQSLDLNSLTDVGNNTEGWNRLIEDFGEEVVMQDPVVGIEYNGSLSSCDIEDWLDTLNIAPHPLQRCRVAAIGNDDSDIFDEDFFDDRPSESSACLANIAEKYDECSEGN